MLTSSLLKNSNEDNLDSGWYVLNSSFTYDERIVISGNVHLILKDGCTLTANQGIRINTDATLSIYAQSEKVGTMGKLVATETHHDKAAIGGNKDYEAGRLFIHGGEIEADADDGKYAAGIGGGYGDGSGMKAITIYSGTVTANAGSYSAGIGGGWQRDGGYVRISGGTVTAENTGAGASIGGGDGASGGTIEITGGRVIAKATKLYGESVHPACNIGSGAGKNNQTIILGSNICVKSESGLVVASQRIEACKGPQSSPSSWHGSQLWTVEVYACAHDTVSYTINDASKHTIHCKHCDYTKNEEHSIVAPSTTCEKCGYGEGTTICTLAFPETSTAEVSGYATAGFQAVQGRAIAMPACTKVPEGWTFVGWLRQSNAPSSIEAADSEGTLWQPGSLYIVEGDEIFFARYRYDFTETWTWDDDLTTASLTIQAADGEPINVTPVTVGDRTATAATDAADGSIKATATATYTHGNTTYTFSDTQTKVLSYNLSLGEDDNTEALTKYDGRSMNVTLAGRTLYKDGSWNTLCLPFDVALEDYPLAGATVKELTDVSFDSSTGSLTLTFADATRIEAGQAYLIKWDSGTDLGPSDLVFNGVTLSQTLCDDEISVDDSGSATVTFMGTYKKLSYTADDKSILFLGADNKLYYPKSGASIGAQRAYFKLSGLNAGDLSTGINSFTLNFGDGEMTTGITEIDNGKMKDDGSRDGWFMLDGRKLPGKPTQKGVYINNGRKVVMK